MATYISNGTGDWTTIPWLTAATGTFGPTAPAAGSPPSFGLDKIVIRRPNVVTYNTSGVFGDGGNGNAAGTINPNINTASIILSGGTLRASRTVNTALTAIGCVWISAESANLNGSNSFLDWGTLSDPVSAVTASISLSSAFSAGIYASGNTTATTVSNSACFCGLEKTRNTFLTLSAAANANTITVDNVFNWKINDELVIESDTLATSRALTGVRITGFSGVDNKTITISPTLNFARLSGTRVGNFTSTVLIETVPSSTLCNGVWLRGLPNGIYQFSNITLKDFGSYWRDTSTGNIIGTTNGAIHYIALYNKVNPIFKGIAYLQTKNANQMYGSIYIQDPSFEPLNISNISQYSITSTSNNIGVRIGINAIVNLDDYVCYRATNALTTGSPYKLNITNSYLNSELINIGTVAGSFSSIVKGRIINSKIKSNAGLVLLDNLIDLELINCDISISPSVAIADTLNNAFGSTTIRDCTLSAPLSTSITSTINRTIRDCDVNVYNPNNSNVFVNFNTFHYLEANSSVRKNGIRSLSFTPKIANTPFEKMFSIPAVQGVTQKIKGNLRFDSNYGTATPPTILFSGAVSNTTFTCPSVDNTWHSFEYDLIPNSTGDIEIKISGQSSNTNGKIYLDGLFLDPFNTNIRWYGFEIDKNNFRTVDTLTTLTENQVSSVDITNLDRLYDASNYWTINNPLSTSYLDLYTKNGDILNFGNRNIVFNNSASTNFAYASASNTITIKTPLLSAGNNFIGLRTTGTISISSNSNVSYVDIYGNINQQTPTSLSGVYMEGTLSYNTGADTSIEYIDCSMDTVQNLGGGFITIKKTNSTITNGNDAEILDYVPTLIDIENMEDGSIAIFDNNGTRRYYQNAPADNIIVLPSTATGTWRYHIARYRFNFIQENFVVDGGTKTISPDYIPDNFVTGDSTTTAAYTDLNSTQRIYNYLSYYTTTSEGIDYDPFYDKAFGSITINKNVTLNATAASVFSYNGTSLVTLKCSSLTEDVLFVSSNNVTYINGTTLSDDVRVRAANLDSELLMSGVTTLTLYPSPQDRDDNTDAGEILTGTIYRFLYGSTTPLGVPLVNFLYNRVNVSGTILLNDTAIVTGRNVLQFETTGTLQQIINNQKVINQGIQKASKLIPHTTNI
jgi:hypothetical protein